jgi:nitric oxide reductase NorD protein
MEEIAGKLWDRLMHRVTDTRHRAATVRLPEIARSAGIFFRALGGDSGLDVKATQATEHGARRSWLQRIAGSGGEAELAWRDREALYLPDEIAWFPDRNLNRDAYLWLVALAAESRPGDWFAENQRASLRVFECYPGLLPRYQRLTQALIAQRPVPASLPSDERAREAAIQSALLKPGCMAAMPPARRAWQPVYLWLHPNPPGAVGSTVSAALPVPESGGTRDQVSDDKRRRSAERTDMPEGKDGFMLFFRAESILSWADYIRVNRPTEDEDHSDPGAAAHDMKRLSLTRDGKSAAARVRFDLDLPPEDADDTPLGPGIWVPEWQHKTRILQPSHCRIQPMMATTAPPSPLPPHLVQPARRIRRQFEALMPGRVWLKQQHAGDELDLDACIEHAANRHLRRPAPERGLFKDVRKQQRDLACLLLADLSLSTDAYVNNQARVIDVIRDTLFLFSEALSATGDRFGLYGFSSLRRNNVRFHVLKDFSERYEDRTRGRIAALKPGYYTRMGAAIRHAAGILAEQRAGQRLLLILTDGKPNDLDHYEGRYGFEDTRHAILEARERGLQPFCVTVDERGSDYLSHLFGLGRYVLIRKPAELPRQMPRLYAQLTS